MATAVLDFDLECLPAHVEGLGTHTHAWILIRYRGYPVGQVSLRVENGELVTRDLRATLCEAAGNDLKSRLVDELLTPLRQSSPRAAGLAATLAICTRERPGDLRTCLSRVIRYLPAGHEVMVVDNHPETDATRAVVESFPGVRYVVEPKPGLNAARNCALRHAEHQIVAFTDDDALPEPEWLPSLLTHFDDRLTLCVTGLTVPLELETEAQELHEQHSPFGRGFHRKVFDSSFFDPMASGHVGAGVNMALRKRVVDLVGTFDEALDVGTPTRSGGDNEMFARILAAGYRIVYEPAALSRHRHRRTRRELRRAFHGYGVGVYAAWTRSLIEERELGVISVALSWLLKRQLPNIVRCLIRPSKYPPLDLVLAELAGCALGPWNYGISKRRCRTP